MPKVSRFPDQSPEALHESASIENHANDAISKYSTDKNHNTGGVAPPAIAEDAVLIKLFGEQMKTKKKKKKLRSVDLIENKMRVFTY